MAETIADIVGTALAELVLPPRSGSIVGSTDGLVSAMVAMANSAGRDLVRKHQWGNLVTLRLEPTVTGQSDYALPTDYHRLVEDTLWDRSTNRRVSGPITPQADRYLREGALAQGQVYRQVRLIGTRAIRVFPTPPNASGLIVYEYVSRAFVRRADGTTTATAFTLDTDTSVFDFDLMVKECKWRWMHAKGQDASEYQAERNDALARLMAADIGGTVLDMGDDFDAAEGPNYRLADGHGNFNPVN